MHDIANNFRIKLINLKKMWLDLKFDCIFYSFFRWYYENITSAQFDYCQFKKLANYFASRAGNFYSYYEVTD